MYPFPIITTGTSFRGDLPMTGLAVGLLGFVAACLIFGGLVLARSMTVAIDPDAKG